MLRRSFDTEFKKARVRQVLSGEKRVGEVIEEHDLVQSNFAKWRKQFKSIVLKELKENAAKAATHGNTDTAGITVSSPEAAAAPPSVELAPPSHAIVKGTKSLDIAQLRELTTRITNKEKPALIARAMQIHPQTVHYHKSKLKKAGELMPEKAPGNGAPVAVTPTMTNVSDQLAKLIHDEYDARLVDHIGPKESLMLALWHMQHGRL